MFSIFYRVLKVKKSLDVILNYKGKTCTKPKKYFSTRLNIQNANNLVMQRPFLYHYYLRSGHQKARNLTALSLHRIWKCVKTVS